MRAAYHACMQASIHTYARTSWSKHTPRCKGRSITHAQRVCVCARACVGAWVRACVRATAWVGACAGGCVWTQTRSGPRSAGRVHLCVRHSKTFKANTHQPSGIRSWMHHHHPPQRADPRSPVGYGQQHCKMRAAGQALTHVTLQLQEKTGALGVGTMA